MIPGHTDAKESDKIKGVHADGWAPPGRRAILVMRKNGVRVNAWAPPGRRAILVM